MKTNLSKFNNSWYDPGRCFFTRTAWHFINIICFLNPLNISSMLKIIMLKCFGAKIGKGVVFKPGINIKYPWNLEIGDNSWIGEGVWLDSLAPVKIGNNVCISQGAYFCTGNHDWTDPGFGLLVSPITVEDGAWIGAKSVILPGVTVASHSILTAGSVISKNTEKYMIYSGNPAVAIRKRKIK